MASSSEHLSDLISIIYKTIDNLLLKANKLENNFIFSGMYF